MVAIVLIALIWLIELPYVFQIIGTIMCSISLIWTAIKGICTIIEHLIEMKE